MNNLVLSLESLEPVESIEFIDSTEYEEQSNCRTVLFSTHRITFVLR